ncbi:MAG: DUF4160 domain-containing protein [Deltaproteobacteria bacterium]|nr:DUF4160 domain-containing protein [Deltaproteobacteria bacterium]
MPIISVFFGITVRLFYCDHNPPHVHVEYQGNKVTMDFRGNILKGDLRSRTATKLIRDWIDLRQPELLENWQLALQGKEVKGIDPLN